MIHDRYPIVHARDPEFAGDPCVTAEWSACDTFPDPSWVGVQFGVSVDDAQATLAAVTAYCVGLTGDHLRRALGSLAEQAEILRLAVERAEHLARGGDLTADLIADDPTERDRVLAAAQKWRDVATALREVSP